MLAGEVGAASDEAGGCAFEVDLAPSSSVLARRLLDTGW